MNDGRVNSVCLTALAVVAFSGNSLLTRWALAGGEMSAANFVAIRLVSGALVLALLNARAPRSIIPRTSDWGGIASLVTYALAFTYAYVRLGAAVGALILFPMVQLTLVAAASRSGAPPSRREAGGLLVALVGVVWLLAPKATQPALCSVLLMGLAGIAWGVYTLLGRQASDPSARTARNFIGAAPFALLVPLIDSGPVGSVTGILLAVASGAVTSALGYSVWYAVLPRLTVAGAGAAQLLVPAITALTAVAWLREPPSMGLVGSSALILSGVWLAMGFSRRIR